MLMVQRPMRDRLSPRRLTHQLWRMIRSPRFLVRCWAVALLLAPTETTAQRRPRWLAAWGASHNLREVIPGLSNSTVRMIVRPTVSGTALRVKLENTMGQSTVRFARAYIGVLDTATTAAVVGRNVAITFGGTGALSLAPGDGVWSDPIPFPVRAFQRLAVSVDVDSAADASTHSLGLTSTYLRAGHHAARVAGDGYAQVPTRATGTTVDAYPVYWLAAVDVQTTEADGAVLGFGDSITDGRCSTTLNGVVRPDVNQRWTDLVAERFTMLPRAQRKAVANAAIAGNRIVAGGNGPTALERLARDVLPRAGVTHVVFFEGTNDIASGATATQVIDGTKRIIDQVHATGMNILGVTIVPRGRPDSVRGWTAEMESHRLAVNRWIRTDAAFDGVIDFDALLTGGPVSSNGQSIKPEFNCDGIHPNAAGYRVMANAVDLTLFGARRRNPR
jgi:lysophospholipase L1-like esterase